MSKSKLIKFLPLIFFIFTCGCANESEILNQQYIHYGVIVPKSQWEDAGQTGQIVLNLKGGITCCQNYYWGILEGQTTYTFPFSQNIERVELYSQNQRLKEMTFYSSGSPHYETIYSPHEHLLIKEWYENGSLKSFEKYARSLLAHSEYYDSQGQRVSKIEAGWGIPAMPHTADTLSSSATLEDGSIEYVTLFNKNGIPIEINPYVNGVVHGCRQTFLPGGEPHTQETWERGHQQGITTLFLNGDRSQEIPYVDGIKNGKSRHYKDGEIIIQELTWRNDKLHGPAYTFLPGRTITDWYYKGNKVSKAYYDSFYPPTPLSLPVN